MPNVNKYDLKRFSNLEEISEKLEDKELEKQSNAQKWLNHKKEIENIVLPSIKLHNDATDYVRRQELDKEFVLETQFMKQLQNRNTIKVM